MECSPLGHVEKVVLECESLSERSGDPAFAGLSRFFEIKKFLCRLRLNPEENRTSKLVHSKIGFSIPPLGEPKDGWTL